jgi:CBS domain-containing protein
MATVEAVLARKGTDVYGISPGTSVLDAARKMNDRGVGGLVVLEAGRLVGIFTERDILRRVVAPGLDPGATLVRDVMTTPVHACGIGTTLEDCRRIMTERRIRHLPVVSQERLFGIVTIGDILAHRADEQDSAIEYLSTYMFGGLQST